MRAQIIHENQYLENASPVLMRISRRLSFIFMTTVDEEDGVNIFCQEINVLLNCRQNARARALARPRVI